MSARSGQRQNENRLQSQKKEHSGLGSTISKTNMTF